MNQTATSPTSEGATGTAGKTDLAHQGATAPAEPNGATDPQETIEEAHARASTSVPEAGTRDAGDAETKAEKPKVEEKPKSKAQDRINEAVRRQREAERAAAAATDKAARLEARLAKLEGAKPNPNDPKFQGDDGADEFQAALTAYQVRQATKDEKQADADEAREDAKQSGTAAAQARNATYRIRAEEFAARVPDFDEKVGKLNVSDAVADEIEASEKGPEIAYFLASNPSEGAKLAAATNATEVAREIGRLEGRISQPTSKRLTNAPDPVKPVATGSGSQIAYEDRENPSYDDVAARLRAKGVIV